ncbi:MAG: aminotransferase [Oscillospiraceae bacterium]|jgi:aspartate/methionine/tyrosine aminotransferase|nr:aminotransferase [Oscillospiraceae bacterium]
MTKDELQKQLNVLKKRYQNFKLKNLKLDMSRGTLSKEQLDLSMPMLNILSNDSNFTSDSGIDYRNYGFSDGIWTLRYMFAQILNVKPFDVFVGGNSSLSMMFDVISLYMTHGACGKRPWSSYERGIKFLCPVPGYDRHFKILSHFGIEQIPIPMKKDGPDMNIIEEAVKSDELIKGIFCVPKYSNPQGIVYSDETVKRFSNLSPKSSDFRIFWDNAYAVHDLTGSCKFLLSLMNECLQNSTEDLPIMFCSTSKITFPGSGVAALAASQKNLLEIKRFYSFKTIGFDKLNQLRHAKFLKDYENILEHMKKHRKILRPKFQVVINCLSKEFSEQNKDIASWSEPKGGYFVSVDLYPGLAKQVIKMCKKAGVKLTDAGATFPNGIDPNDSNIRLAPTCLPANELALAMHLFCICIKLTAIEKKIKTLEDSCEHISN